MMLPWLVLGACGSDEPSLGDAGSLEAGTGDAGFDAGTEPPDCGEEIPGADPLYEASSLVVFGDCHGTNEIPAFVGRFACLAAKRTLPLSVGLEIPIESGAGIELGRSCKAYSDFLERASEPERAAAYRKRATEIFERLKVSALQADLDHIPEIDESLVTAEG